MKSNIYLLKNLAVTLIAFLRIVCACARTIDRPAISAYPTDSHSVVPRFEPSVCPISAPVGVECGYLVVPQDRVGDVSGGRVLRLVVAILKSHNNRPVTDPIVYLRGGPGESPLKMINTFINSQFLEQRDFIILEYRGSQYSDPQMGCPELLSVIQKNFTRAESDEIEIAAEVEAAVSCRDRLQDEGIHLFDYNSPAIAADLEDLRQTLGYPRINLYGVSHGTRIALTMMRNYPAGIRSVILDSVYTPDHRLWVDLIPQASQAIELLADRCATNPKCNLAYPTLKAEFYELIARSNSRPISVPVKLAGQKEIFQTRITGGDLAAIIVLSMEQTYFLPYLPYLINQLYQGHNEVLVPLLENYLPGLSMFSNGMHYSVECYERTLIITPQDSLDRMKTFPLLSNFYLYRSEMAICKIWGVGQADPDELEPVASDIPALVLSGEFDPVTPPTRGEVAIRTLPNSYHYVFPGMGHAVTYIPGCAQDVAVDFVNNPTIPPNISCLSDMTKPVFVADADLIQTLAMYDLIGRPNIAWDILLVVSLLMFLSTTVLWPVSLLRGLGRPTPKIGRERFVARGLAFVTAALSLTFTSTMIISVANSNVDMLQALVGLMFGVPTQRMILFIFPLVIAILTIGLLVCTFLAWKGRYWNLVGRIHYTGVAISTMTFAGWLIYWTMR